MNPLIPSKEAIPREFADLDRWLCWRPVEGGGGRITKPPVNPRTGYPCGPNDTSAFASLDEAVEGARRFKDVGGVGFAIPEGITVVDLDDVRCPERGALQPWAETIVETLDSWTETSVSGTGLHIAVKATIAGSRKIVHEDRRVELLSAERYVTVSGRVLRARPLNDAQAWVDRVIAWADRSQSARRSSPRREARRLVAAVPPRCLSDDEVVHAAKNGKNGLRFAVLWAGGPAAYAHYDGDQHRTDLALAEELAFRSYCDVAQVERLMWRSGLVRDGRDPHQFNGDKWVTRPSYVRNTVEQACRKVLERHNVSVAG